MLSLLCMLNAFRHPDVRAKQSAWLVACAALSVLAMDEYFGAHEFVERTQDIDDDHFKVVLWLMTAGVLSFICLAERVFRRITYTLLTGYGFHSLYILVEVGDGDYFRLPFASVHQLKYAEELFELLFLSLYWLGLVTLYLRTAEK